MSRVGKRPITILENVQVKLENGQIIVTGPKGNLNYNIHPQVKIEINEKEIKVLPSNSSALEGLTRSLIANMITGVTTGFKKTLQITGIGYKARVEGKNLILNLGFSHPVVIPISDAIDIKVKENNQIEISGIDKQLVGAIAAKIRKLKEPEPYKGKGISYLGERIRRKVGKRGAV